MPWDRVRSASVIVCLLFALPAFADGNWAVVIGVGSYRLPQEKLEPLAACRTGAACFAEYLLGSGAVPKDHIAFLGAPGEDPSAPMPTRENILRAMQEVGVHGCDAFYFYISTHGGSPDGKTYFYATWDTDLKDIDSTALPMEVLWKAIVESVHPRRAWLFADTCHSAHGGAKGALNGWNQTNVRISGGGVQVAKAPCGLGMMFSCYDTEESLVGAWSGMGLFTYCLLRALGGWQDADVDHDGTLTLHELYSVVEHEVDLAARSLKRSQLAWFTHVGEFDVDRDSLPLYDVFLHVLAPLGMIEVAPVGIRMTRVRAGRFRMGSPLDEKGRGGDEALHDVTIGHEFFLGCTEVTQQQYEGLMGKNPSLTKDGKLPVDNVSWQDATDFCAELNKRTKQLRFRLPTEAEWEYACRADSRTPWYFGSEAALLSAHAWWAEDSQRKLQPVGTRAPNSWGLFDMLGNAWEWCADGYGEYAQRAETDPLLYPNSTKRVLRGGCVIHEKPSDLRCAARHFAEQDCADYYYGFRVAADAVKK